MSHSRFTASESSSLNFQLIMNDALKVYEKRTKKDLAAHPLASRLDTCNSPGDVVNVLMEQIDGTDQSAGRAYEKWTKWLDPTINVLLTFSSVVGAAGLTIAPVALIFSGIDILISAAKDFRESEETLVDIFECIGRFLKRLEIYTEVPQTTEMMDKIAQIMAEVLTILGIATRDIKQGRIKKFVKMLMGRTDMKDALERFDMLTREEAWMAIVRVMRAVHAIDETVALASIEYRVIDA